MITCSMVKSKVKFSRDEQHRYILKRVWDEEKPLASVIMLNPTKVADALSMDRSIMKFFNILVSEGEFGGFYLVNIFSYRSNVEKELLKKPCKDRNDSKSNTWIEFAIKNSETTYIAWGSNENRKTRIKEVQKIIKKCSRNKVNVFLNKSGSRVHLSRAPKILCVKSIPIDDILLE